MANSLYRIPNITSIRFFLALLVVIFHTSEFFQKRGFPYYNGLPIFHKGTDAVYVFFTLSGFLIIKQLYVEKIQTGSISLKKFYVRRMLRIFPLYYLILVFGFLYYHFILPYFGFSFENNYNILSAIALGVTFFPNILSTYEPGGILEILWSIGIEEQFYLVVAPLILLIPSRKMKLFLGIFTALYFIVYFFSGIEFLSNYRMLFFYFSFSGLCAIAIENSYVKRLINTFWYVIIALFFLYLTTSWFEIENTVYNHLFNMIAYSLGILALSQKPIKFLENKTINYFGKISYGIYMYHAIVMQFIGFLYLKFISKFNFSPAVDIIISNILVVSITIFISHISYKYYETYFLRKKQRVIA